MTDRDNHIRESVGFILFILAIVIVVFLSYHGGELAELIMDKLR